jgi:hypothetical protein
MGIRSVDTQTTVLVEGDNWAHAYQWELLNGNFIINDPANKLFYEAHEYFDKAAGGKYENSYDQDATYSDIGVSRIQPFLDWLERNNVNGFLGEFGVPNNDPRWNEVLARVLTRLEASKVSGTIWAYRNQAGWWPASLFINTRGGQNGTQMTALLAHIQPTITSLRPDPGIISEGRTTANVLTLAGSAPAGSTVKLFDGAIEIGTLVANSNGRWEFTTNRLNVGLHTFVAAKDTTRAMSTSGVSIFVEMKPAQPPSNPPNK